MHRTVPSPPRRKVKVDKFPFIGNGKAIALGEAEVTELIQGYAVARQLETTEEDLMHTVFPHPTLSEMMHESVLDAYGRALHY